ncbi:uncharacterized protein BDZ99DRAFT_459377 [Mytilinidion resinicola]|uniref:Casein kinase substrate phosphoprotein PP28 domain-containing protein n=1 Tax=Mytilinidion resinicola TaxID=574789 RepID=A0A6A6Z343_9PEZI|nr:uncharacterized protein BDZ99DRAFT_459377 [Mytilinidion resinicola]KAF2815526.1 hypothetical protein BDZ99DRAFT_459377 [Mytilinidion resinicola]
MSSSAGGRGRGGKFSKPKRGGGKHFSRDLQPLNADGEVMGMWGDAKPKTLDEESEDDDEDDESSEEESSEDESNPKEALSREQRKAAAKARKLAAIAKQNKKSAAPGDMPSSSEEEDDDEEDGDMPANPNHSAKARTQAATLATPADAEAISKDKAKTPVSQLSRREREALQAQQAKERYQKLHAEGKTDEARADLERLSLVRERRAAEAARKKAEAEEKAEQDKSKAEQLEREKRMREAALGKKGAKGGKKKP